MATTEHQVLLFIEDNSADAADIIDMLRQVDVASRFAVVVAGTLADGIKSVKEADIVLVDLLLPDSYGIDTFRRLNKVCAAPIIVVTGTHDNDLGLRAIKEGAQDFLVKGEFSAQTLYRSIMYAIERQAREIAELRLSQLLEVFHGMSGEIRALSEEIAGARTAMLETAGCAPAFDCR